MLSNSIAVDGGRGRGGGVGLAAILFIFHLLTDNVQASRGDIRLSVRRMDVKPAKCGHGMTGRRDAFILSAALFSLSPRLALFSSLLLLLVIRQSASAAATTAAALFISADDCEPAPPCD